jgi:hypothetical protein
VAIIRKQNNNTILAMADGSTNVTAAVENSMAGPQKIKTVLSAIPLLRIYLKT